VVSEGKEASKLWLHVHILNGSRHRIYFSTHTIQRRSDPRYHQSHHARTSMHSALHHTAYLHAPSPLPPPTNTNLTPSSSLPTPLPLPPAASSPRPPQPHRHRWLWRCCCCWRPAACRRRKPPSFWPCSPLFSVVGVDVRCMRGCWGVLMHGIGRSSGHHFLSFHPDAWTERFHSFSHLHNQSSFEHMNISSPFKTTKKHNHITAQTHLGDGGVVDDGEGVVPPDDAPALLLHRLGRLYVVLCQCVFVNMCVS
jgi:hypothetical protein